MNSRNRCETGRIRARREAGSDDELLPVLLAWRRLAARAWEGYLAHGPGVVTVDIGEDVAFGYRLGAPCHCHAEWIDGYDPEAEIVLLVRRGASEWLYRLGGWPAPPAAFASVPAQELDAAVH